MDTFDGCVTDWYIKPVRLNIHNLKLKLVQLSHPVSALGERHTLQSPFW